MGLPYALGTGTVNSDSCRSSVQDYYGKVLASHKDLKTNVCTAAEQLPPEIAKLIAGVPAEVLEKFYGCGSPLPAGINGLRLLDLGSGSGRDCLLAAALVGEGGSVTGVDMTQEQIEVNLRQ